jgi:lysozyme family protein
VAGVTVLGPALTANFDASGGQFSVAGTDVSVVVPADSLNGQSLTARTVRVDPASLPALPAGFQIGPTAIDVLLLDSATGEPESGLPGPLVLTSQLDANLLEQAGGQSQRVRWATFVNGAWQALPCTISADNTTLTCSLANGGLLALVVTPQPAELQDWDVPDGHFFLQTNGFNGAGDLGYAVVDDDSASMWSEFQRLGGVETVGYPVSGRFQYRGFITQAFQKLALQWRPDLGQAVPVNVLDELNQRGSDAWLDQERQVPPAADTSADAGLDFNDVVSRHVALLDAYPELADFYASAPDALDRLGLPLSVKDYGPFVSVRLQRAALQLWKIDTPSVAAGSVVTANGSDLAKEIGLWPAEADAVSPAPAPPPSAAAP